MNQNVLADRAKELSRPLSTIEELNDFIEILIFTLGEERFALEIKYIVEVYPLKEYTSLPGAPSFVFGLTNVRRKIILIFDLKVLFSMPEGNGEKLIILGNEQTSFALLIDGFNEIHKLPKDKIQSLLPTLTGIREEFLLGLMEDGTVILDGKKLLTSKHLVLDEV